MNKIAHSTVFVRCRKEMVKMKRILSVLMILGLMFTLSACGNKREMYNVNLEKYVELGNYKGLELDTDSAEYKKNYQDKIVADIIENGYQSDEVLTEGTVKAGDIANINYVGKKDGAAFEGGTADNYDLTIGSGSFIDGFEEGLIGVEIGSTVDLDLTFPSSYDNEELAGKAVVFTVKVNSVKSAMAPEEFYKKAGYKTVEDYYDSVGDYTAQGVLISQVIDNSKIKDYPEKDFEFMLEKSVENYDNYYQQAYNMTLEEALSALGQTLDYFKEQLEEYEVKPNMEVQMVLYAIFDDAQLSYKESEIEEIAREDNNQEEKYYYEFKLIVEKVSDFLYENAKIS